MPDMFYFKCLSPPQRRLSFRSLQAGSEKGGMSGCGVRKGFFTGSSLILFVLAIKKGAWLIPFYRKKSKNLCLMFMFQWEVLLQWSLSFLYDILLLLSLN